MTESPLAAPPGGTGAGHRVPWSVLDAVVTFVAYFVVSTVVFILLTPLRGNATTDGATLPISLSALGVTVLAYVRLRYPESFGRLFGTVRPAARHLAIGLGVGLLAFFVIALGMGNLVELVFRFMGADAPPIQEDLRQLAEEPATTPFLVIGAGLVGPIAEELFFRGMLFTALRRHLDLWPAAGISGLLFAVVHIQTSLEGYIVVVALIFPLGILLGWLYERTGSLVVPMVTHAVYNIIQVLLLVGLARGGQLL